MRLYKRSEFVKLPPNTIYSRVNEGDMFGGLYCKTSGEDWLPDFIEQNLISETGYPEGINDGHDAFCYTEKALYNFQDIRTDLNCSGRDGLFDDSDYFVVWDNEDINKLINYLQNCIQ